jgi:hypothetical protein
VSKSQSKLSQVASPAATSGAGAQFEAKVGAFYLLSMLAESPPRGLPGAAVQSVNLQQRGSGRPLDDVIVEAMNADGSDAVLEIQAKRSLTFTASDQEFAEVVAQIWEAAQKPEFRTSRYELAVAIAKTTTRVEHACQEVLRWAKHLPDGATFSAHIKREKFARNQMRDFVDVFRRNLAAVGAPTDDETVWRLLRRFQILVFDFEAPGSDYEYRARERARLALNADQAGRASDLWPVLIDQTGACATAGGALTRPEVVTLLEKQHGFRFDPRASLRTVYAHLSEAANCALDEIKDQVGGVRLARAELVDTACAALETNRILHIQGAPGVGKSAVMKQLVLRLEHEGRIIALRNGRIIQGGWSRMRHEIECPISREELFNELGCGGGATLFIDNIDQIDGEGEWSTVTDLLVAAVRNQGWRAVVTGGIGVDNWKARLPEEVRDAGIATLTVESLDDDEAAVLSEGNQALAIVLGSDHPAREMARNLFYLSKMVEFGEAAAGVATEMDLAHLWWDFGGGRSLDDRRFDRLKTLRAMGAQTIDHPGRVAFRVDDLPSPAMVAELLRSDTLREQQSGAEVAFRHDVLRDWTVGFLLHEQEERLNSIGTDKPLPAGLARGLEIAARLAIDSDGTGASWLSLLAAVERPGSHGSWKRPILLALPRSEQAFVLFQSLKGVLLESDGHRLSEIIRLMISVESEPMAKAIARIQPSATVPAEAADFIVPRGNGWVWLVLWLVENAKSLPAAVIPNVSKVFQAWLMTMQQLSPDLSAHIVGLLFEWLALIEEAMTPCVWHGPGAPPRTLSIPHIRAVRDEIRMTVFSFAHLNPTAAEGYLLGLDPDAVRHTEAKVILAASSLAKAAPAALTAFALAALVEKKDSDDLYASRRDRLGPFGVHDHDFSPASPGQGPFFELLEHAPVEGLRLVRGVVEHATQWRREAYNDARQSFPRISIPFPDGAKSFEGDWSVYHWARGIAPSLITASALMALEAWGHRQIEAGRPFLEVLHDVLGPDGSSVAFASVAIDLVLSHWRTSRDTAWPLVATPELLQLDNVRLTRDLAGVDRMLTLEQESKTWRIKRTDLDARPSRKDQLSENIGYYVFHAEPEVLEALRGALEQACNEIGQRPMSDEDPINGLHATAKRALRMTNPGHWLPVKVTLEDGSETVVRQFQRDPEEMRLIEVETKRADMNMRHLNVRLKVWQALFDRTKSAPEIVTEGIEWARAQLTQVQLASADGEDEDFDKEWDQRAILLAAALAARDYEGSDRDDVVTWASQVLRAAAAKNGKEYLGNDQIEYNATAIATLGLIELYLDDRDVTLRDELLRLASHDHLAVINALGSKLTDLSHIDAGLPRSIIRIAMASTIHPHRVDDERHAAANEQAYRHRVEETLAEERHWFGGSRDEPPWPDLPHWQLRPIRSLRIGGSTEEDDEHGGPEHYVDEHALGRLIGHLIPFTVGDVPPWLIDLASHLMQWTTESNVARDESERGHPPFTWHSDFFDFVGILSVALPHEDVVAKFLGPIMEFSDDSFHDAIAEFLRGFDRATLATDTREPENPAAIRELLANRLRRSRNFKHLSREKGYTSEVHAGDALNAMFYQQTSMLNRGRPYVPDNWGGLDATMPTLTALACDAASSGYVASLHLNLVACSPRATFLPFVVQAMMAWCAAYGEDTNFWVEKEFGPRLCAWLDRTLTRDSSSVTVLPSVRDDLLKCLDTLIRSGVAQAREIEEQVTQDRNVRSHTHRGAQGGLA